jgi:hypothetical protein
MGESCLDSFQDAQDCLPLTLADTADGDLFELGTDLLQLGAQGSTGSGGFDRERALDPDWRLLCATGAYAMCSAASGSVDGASTGV